MLLTEQRGHVLVVTMNRPQARNALSPQMTPLMAQAWDRVDAEPDIRVCILTGAGGAFCAGADLKAMTSDHPGDRMGEIDVSVIESLLKGRRLTKPLIAAVEGRRSPAAPRSCRRATSGWPARARASASPRPAGACSPWAARRCG